MATFAKKTFDAASYALARPKYPRALFDHILSYHKTGVPTNVQGFEDAARERADKLRWLTPGYERALDLGCGTGQATVELTPFKNVVGVDPSEKMLEGARAHVLETLGQDVTDTFQFHQSVAEELPFIEDGSVDLTIAAQAVHWFDYAKFWPELARVTRPGGTAALWVYSEFRLPKYPELAPLITEYHQGSTALGKHWEQPGRSILNNHLLDVPEPDGELGFAPIDRVYFMGGYYPELPRKNTFPLILRKQATWEGLREYLRTFSSLHDFLASHPMDKKNARGDIAERFIQSLMDSAYLQDRVRPNLDDPLMIEWPVSLLLLKKLA
ncbi:S-adenosyl-L-methionine-dependent methyltransferase [Cylindrobasidium torrendii FP15055 ss-10]|uniref:S-adenosyl-L-methionine-dependent methyltransferase n=1 Tax=Cylindrobasidium torrendii FP15055 ss-10 TaxID=1314674 RepID=A0A0D7ATX0_9AGAR|nr:S-adenosyl-L-methionine-dependent methyltransferase [Cylindrobasidium torrendii FP15055 ss-10]